MESIIQGFNKVMDDYNREYTSAASQKEQQDVNKKYEEIISKAEVVMEKSMEEFIKKEEELLRIEQEKSTKQADEGGVAPIGPSGTKEPAGRAFNKYDPRDFPSVSIMGPETVDSVMPDTNSAGGTCDCLNCVGVWGKIKKIFKK